MSMTSETGTERGERHSILVTCSVGWEQRDRMGCTQVNRSRRAETMHCKVKEGSGGHHSTGPFNQNRKLAYTKVGCILRRSRGWMNSSRYTLDMIVRRAQRPRLEMTLVTSSILS